MWIPRLSVFANADGRSIVRALICVVLLNTFVVGLHAGAMAATSPEMVICTIDGISDAGDNLADGHPPPCCMPSNSATALLPEAPAASAPAVRQVLIAPLAQAPPQNLSPASYQPRGPPSLA